MQNEKYSIIVEDNAVLTQKPHISKLENIKIILGNIHCTYIIFLTWTPVSKPDFQDLFCLLLSFCFLVWIWKPHSGITQLTSFCFPYCRQLPTTSILLQWCHFKLGVFAHPQNCTSWTSSCLHTVFSSIPFQGVDILRLKLSQPPRAHQTWTQKTRKSGLAVVLVKTSHTICSVSIQLSTTVLVSLISFLTKSMSIASRKSFTTTLSPWAWSYTGLLSVDTRIRSFPQILDHLWGCSHDTWPHQQVHLKVRLSCYIDNHGWGVWVFSIRAIFTGGDVFFQLCYLFLVGLALGFEKGLPRFCPKVPCIYIYYVFFWYLFVSVWYIWDR